MQLGADRNTEAVAGLRLGLRGEGWLPLAAGTVLSAPVLPDWAWAVNAAAHRMVPTTRASLAVVWMSRGAFVAAQCLDFTKHLRC